MRNDWFMDVGLLQCIACDEDLTADASHGLACRACGRAYPVRNGILEAMDPLTGNNQVALELYDSRRWRRARFLEKTVFFFLGGERRARRGILDHLPPLDGTRILELAIGDGANVPAIPASCSIYGVDISRPQMEACARLFPDRDLRLLMGQAERLPFNDGTFDHVVSVGAFNHFSDPLGSLREMARVTKPGGHVLVADERPDFADGLLKHSFGRRILHALFGPDFTDVVSRNRGLQVAPIAAAVLQDWRVDPVWGNRGYALVGRAPCVPAGQASATGTR